ncbi:hypothetical protein BABINDRAFT_161765 [Babjeviella inositovora NRRL Y-12698]|uniref:Protein BOI2 n=1 Tax=Babjeviella inositovora NRRL Y-12698 TaxID=984486 RepID=A0A1E3QNZ3_9ASCO|nr:uncharacterized protein BABINDRAFT_161765 [Babjeviella inositovora NRRL Y-12698]ODQ79358.1 hypothetical protein BABINDRAFT_161765 [Babjeviella inositovora NRRL Y-12698]
MTTKPHPPKLTTSFSLDFDSASELPTAGPVYTVIKVFNARLGDELNLQVGDKLEVIADDSEYNDGWYMGRNMVTGETGLYPKTFTQLVLGIPKLLRAASRRVVSNGSTPKGSVASTPTHASPGLSDVPFTRNTSVHKTMSDIDKALQELGESKRMSLDPLEVESWTPEQVSAYFVYLGFDVESAGQFQRHKINGQILLELELTYLKELDIVSFGTRFEMFKEIETLKQARPKTHSNEPYTPQAKRHSLLLAAPITRGASQDRTPPLHQRTKSRSSEDVPFAHFKKLQSQNTTPKSPSGIFDKPHAAHGVFDSPRKAPQPPNHRSPVAEGLSKFRSVLDPAFTSPEQARAPRKRSSMTFSRPVSSMGFDNASSTWLLPETEVKHSSKSKHHRRHSSLFSFASLTGESKSHSRKDSGTPAPGHSRKGSATTAPGHSRKGSATTAPGHSRKGSATFVSPLSTTPSRPVSTINERNFAAVLNTPTNFFDDVAVLLPLKSPTRAASGSPAHGTASPSSPTRAALDNIKFGLRPQQKRTLTTRKKQTSAFQEGIRHISPTEAIRSSDYSGWMSKRGNVTIGTWKTRYFTLHNTRLSYFGSLKDKTEKGLIDITAHKVLPARENEDKFVAIYAASTGSGRYCFKLVPPAPGSKKGLTFTQQKVHYFAVETQDEMREWMAALMKATIDIDETVPVVSSCVTPTISLPKAQEMLAKAREETRLKDEQLRAKGFLQQGYSYNVDEDPAFAHDVNSSYSNKTSSSASTPADLASMTFDPNHKALSMSARTTSTASSHQTSTLNKPHLSAGSGFSSPFLLASGAFSSKSPTSPRDFSAGTRSSKVESPVGVKDAEKRFSSMHF